MEDCHGNQINLSGLPSGRLPWPNRHPSFSLSFGSCNVSSSGAYKHIYFAALAIKDRAPTPNSASGNYRKAAFCTYIYIRARIMCTAIPHCTCIVVVSFRAVQALAGGGVGECVGWVGG